MRRRLRRVGLFVAAAIFAACARKAEKPASRAEALAACIDGCLKKVAEARPSDEQRRTCDQTCGCIVDEMFHATGERRKDPNALLEVTMACVEKLTPQPPSPPPHAGANTDDDSDDDSDDATDQRPSPLPALDGARDPARRGALGPLQRSPPDPRLAIGPALLTGKGCRSAARLPALAYDRRTDRVRVPGETVGWRFPWDWGRPVIERRDLMVLSIGANSYGVIPVFEVFVAPRCDSYDTLPVYERMAARSLIELASRTEIVDQVRRGGWTVERGGPGQETSVVHAAVISTPKGPRRVWLYTTKLAETQAFSVHAAGACPGLEPGSNFWSSCEAQYFGMLKRLTAQEHSLF